jgi:hypothetical protein
VLGGCRLRELDVKAEQAERQQLAAEKERDQWEAKAEVRLRFLLSVPVQLTAAVPSHRSCLKTNDDTLAPGEAPGQISGVFGQQKHSGIEIELLFI